MGEKWPSVQFVYLPLSRNLGENDAIEYFNFDATIEVLQIDITGG